MKKIYVIAIAFMVMFSMATAAIALEYKTIYRESGKSASAEWSGSDGSYTGMYVTETDDGTDIFIIISTMDAFKIGYLYTQEDIFDIDNRLKTAVLSPVDIELYNYSDYTSEVVTINAQWEGTGDLEKGSYKYISKYGNYMEKFSSSSSFREAQATGSIGEDLGISDYANLVAFKSASISMEK